MIVLLDKDLPTAPGLMASQDHPNPSSPTLKDMGCQWDRGGHGQRKQLGRASGALPAPHEGSTTQAPPKEAPWLRVSRSPWGNARRVWERLRHYFLGDLPVLDTKHQCTSSPVGV